MNTEIADYNLQSLNFNSQGMAQHGTDKGLNVRFYMEPMQDHKASEEQGRPIFEDKPFIEINFPGDNTRQVVRPVKTDGDAQGPSDMERFPHQWMAFQRGEQTGNGGSGLPLDEWAAITRSEAKSLKMANVLTVEQLAAVPDGVIHRLGHGGRGLVEKARTWLASTGDVQIGQEVFQQLEHAQNTVAQMQQKLEAAIARIAELEADSTKPKKK
jgi:hypothetical protein